MWTGRCGRSHCCRASLLGQHAVLPLPQPQADEHVLCSSLLCSSTWQVPSETIHDTAGAYRLLTDAIVSLFACGACTCAACAWPRLHDGELKHIVASPSLPCFVYQPLLSLASEHHATASFLCAQQLSHWLVWCMSCWVGLWLHSSSPSRRHQQCCKQDCKSALLFMSQSMRPVTANRMQLPPAAKPVSCQSGLCHDVRPC